MNKKNVESIMAQAPDVKAVENDPWLYVGWLAGLKAAVAESDVSLVLEKKADSNVAAQDATEPVPTEPEEVKPKPRRSKIPE